MAYEPFGTNSGFKAIEYYLFKKTKGTYSLVVFLDGCENIISYTKNGEYLPNKINERDLVMYCEEEKKEKVCYVCNDNCLARCSSEKTITVCQECWFKIFNDCMLMSNSYLHEILMKRVTKRENE